MEPALGPETPTDAKTAPDREFTDDNLNDVDARNDCISQGLEVTTSLQGLQSDEQGHVLNIVDELRKCGLESMLSLPQLVVCGDQSAGKSSVLEALTEIPFPRNDNLCTRFATEIILRRASANALTIKVIPDQDRPKMERDAIEDFKESISDFGELPSLMDRATSLMGINSKSKPNSRAFAKDVLSIEIEGPHRPQLTLVDLPGLIQTQTKGVTEEDVQLVTEITDQYILQRRTICLAVVSASNDHANQGILKKVRKVDPQGDRTLGIITKPDRLPAGSGSEQSFIDLANNEDVFFKLGWHVLKNRTYEEGSSSFVNRNRSEARYFQKSNFSKLSKDCVGIDSLRNRLSRLLFNHVKQELPKLRKDLEDALTDSQTKLNNMGDRRVTSEECKAFLTQLSLDIYEVGKAAVNGHYEGDYFNKKSDETFSPESTATICRLRAVIQHMNSEFSTSMRLYGHKYCIETSVSSESEDQEMDWIEGASGAESKAVDGPKSLTRSKALEWVGQVLMRTRGRELPGSFNPLLIGELFWEQSSKWQTLAKDHVEDVMRVCSRFLDTLLQEKCPEDVYTRLWSSKIEDALKARSDNSTKEIQKIMKDVKSYPITYNHYYTDTIIQRRREREQKSLTSCFQNDSQHIENYKAGSTSESFDAARAMKEFSDDIDPDMENHSREAALDSLYSIYKVRPPFYAFT